jgi:hypothetical protein
MIHMTPTREADVQEQPTMQRCATFVTRLRFRVICPPGKHNYEPQWFSDSLFHTPLRSEGTHCTS